MVSFAIVAAAMVAVSGSTSIAAVEPAERGNPRDVVPETMPFDIPYGPPISLSRAQAVIAAAVSKAAERGWRISFAVLDSGGNIVAVARMDGAQISSPTIAEHKARTAVAFRRPTLVYENGVHNGQLYQLSVDGIIASRGGIPLVENGTLIGAVGAAGGAGAQDQTCAEAGAAVVEHKP